MTSNKNHFQHCSLVFIIGVAWLSQFLAACGSENIDGPASPIICSFKDNVGGNRFLDPSWVDSPGFDARFFPFPVFDGPVVVELQNYEWFFDDSRRPDIHSSQMLSQRIHVESDAKGDEDEGTVVVATDILAVAGKADAMIILPWYADYFKYWSGNFELGLDGVEGNTQTFNFRVGLELMRKTKRTVFSLEIDYRKSRMDNQDTGNMCFLDARLERLLGAGSWSAFIHNTTNYDEFKNYNVLVATDIGLSILLVNYEHLKFKVRSGGGFSQEVGGMDTPAAPEITFGADLDWEIGDRNKLSTTVDVMPKATDFADHRMQFEASWKTIIDIDMNLSLKLAVLDRYDSMPNGNLPNDLDYTLLIVWSF